MLGYAREGKMRSKLRQAILAGFNPASLDEVLRDNDMLASNVAIGPDFATRVNSLIDVARREGWLIELCGVLAEARPDNQRVNSAIVAAQKWLIDHRGSDEVDHEFQPDVTRQQNVGVRYLALVSIMIVAVMLIGVAVWVFVDKKEQTQQSSISTTGDQSPVVTGTKGNVQIDMSRSPSQTATGGGVVIGRDAIGTTITTVPPNPAPALAPSMKPDVSSKPGQGREVATDRLPDCRERLRVRGVHLLADQPCVDLFDVIADLAKGKYFFNKPQSAYVEEPFRVALALPTADGQDVSRVFRGAPGPVEEREARIAQYLQATLRGGLDFRVDPPDPQLRTVTPIAPVVWEWTVVPLRSGNKALVIEVAANLQLGSQKELVQLQTLSEEIQINVGIVRWITSTFFGLPGTALGIAAIFVAGLGALNYLRPGSVARGVAVLVAGDTMPVGARSKLRKAILDSFDHEFLDRVPPRQRHASPRSRDRLFRQARGQPHRSGPSAGLVDRALRRAGLGAVRQRGHQFIDPSRAPVANGPGDAGDSARGHLRLTTLLVARLGSIWPLNLTPRALPIRLPAMAKRAKTKRRKTRAVTAKKRRKARPVASKKRRKTRPVARKKKTDEPRFVTDAEAERLKHAQPSKS